MKPINAQSAGKAKPETIAARRRLYQGASLIAVAAAVQFTSMTPANAQQAAQSGIEEIVVTGSRVITNGLTAPTPVTVVGEIELQNSSPGNLVLAIQQLPVFSISGPATANIGGSSGTDGSSFLSLRNLGNQRTLVLLDGRRMVPQNQLGAPDVNNVPMSLVRRADVVTGGASAAYGSDAVSGVVNLILDTTYTGIKGTLQGGITDKGDKKNYRGSLTGGTTFAGDRGHIVAAGEYSEDDGLKWADRDWAREGWAVITNPTVTAATASPQNPIRITAANVRLATGSLGGLITASPAVAATGTPANLLKGIQFGPGGVPSPFQFGTFLSGSTMVGGDGPQASAYATNLYAPQRSLNGFTHVTYDITDNLSVFGEAMWSKNKFNFISFPNWQTGNMQFTIFSGNPYIPASVQATMTAKNIPSFNLGRLSPDFGPMQVQSTNEARRFVGGFQGEFGEGWAFDSYYTHGVNEHDTHTPYDAILTRLFRAADAVVDPATGAPICRSKQQNPTSTVAEIANCEPINVFGPGSPSPGALNYIMGDSSAHNVTKQDVIAASVRGQPFSTWAGPIGVAFGAEYRKELTATTADPISASVVSVAGINGMPAALNNKVGGFTLTNIQPITGSFHVKEGFVEAEVPLASETSWAKALTLNGAARYADYNLSGGVTTWKAGVVYQPVEDLRLRATRSRDIRNGNLNELFASGTSTQPSVTDPARNNILTTTVASTVGNPDLVPEKADTTAAGVTYQPSWLPGLNGSVDWYNIKIKDAITSLPLQTVVDQCYFEKVASLCALITRDANGVIVFLTGKTLNAASLETNGVDIELGYRTPVSDIVSSWDGELGVRALATYRNKLVTTILGAAPRDNGGEVANPKWKGTLTVNYTNGGASLFLQERYIMGGNNNNTFGPNDIDHNLTPGRYYTDVTARYSFGEEANTEVFLTINNLFDKEPPDTGSFFVIGTRPPGTGQYDQIGRAFTLGVRFSR